MGDAVWLHDPTKKKGLSRKLRNHWIGQFLIVKKISEVTYRIENHRDRNQKLCILIG